MNTLVSMCNFITVFTLQLSHLLPDVEWNNNINDSKRFQIKKTSNSKWYS